MQWPVSDRASRMQPSAIRAMTKLAASAGPDLITLAGGMPNPATFPLEELAGIAAAEIRDHAGRSLQYGITSGFRPLLSWICEYVSKDGIRAAPEVCMCTTGSQQALDLITEVLINPDDMIFVESPTYIGALAVFQKTGAKIISIKQDDSGILLEDLEEKLAEASAGKTKLLYLISNFQNPSGISLIRERRLRLAGLLEKYDMVLIEDDPYGELYFGENNRPPAPVKAGVANRVLYLGTFSKLVAPTFRTGWIIGDEAILRKVELAKEAADLCSSLLDQRILARFCSSKSFPVHLARLREFYSVRRDALLQALKDFMRPEVTWTQPGGGFFIWVKLPERLDSEVFLEEAIREEKVSYIIGRPFTADNSAHNYLRLAYSVEDPDRIREGAARLARVIRRRL